MDWIFGWKYITLENSLGVYLIAMWLFDSFLCVVFMTLIVGRSKLAWDFALTIQLIDLVVVSLYSHGIPMSWVWWALQMGSGLILISLGTWTSRWRELRDTFFEGLNDAELGQSHEMRDMSSS
jgi:ABC-type nickel/cobalt efflux system permease component RcnA